jgi:hypothetical protein
MMVIHSLLCLGVSNGLIMRYVFVDFLLRRYLYRKGRKRSRGNATGLIDGEFISLVGGIAKLFVAKKAEELRRAT